MKKPLDKRLQQALEGAMSKRARTVVEHIIKHGSVTTEDLEKMGYKHPPRAIGDVRDCGIPLVTTRVKSESGRSIGIYTFGDFDEISNGTLGGRKILSKALKNSLIAKHGSKCAICNQEYEGRYLQIDHRVPYRVAGDKSEETDIDTYMLVCGSCNRGKSWSCENCKNWQEIKDPNICKGCYWASPQSYSHIAMEQVRRIDLVWKGEDSKIHDDLAKKAKAQGITLNKLILDVVKKHQ